MIDWAEKKLAVWVLTPHGMALANRVKQALPHADLFASKKLVPDESHARFSTLAKALAPVWDHYDAHYFIMATGIVVRTIAPLIQDKTRDPAVVCGDEAGHFVISLVSGPDRRMTISALSSIGSIGAFEVSNQGSSASRRAFGLMRTSSSCSLNTTRSRMARAGIARVNPSPPASYRRIAVRRGFGA